MLRIAYFFNDADLLFLKGFKEELFAIVLKNSDEEKTAKKELKLKNIVSVKLKNELKKFFRNEY